MKTPATALWNWPLAAALVILSAALSFGAQCDALFNLDDDAKNFLGPADTCLVIDHHGIHDIYRYIACETSKVGYVLPCFGEFSDGWFVFFVAGDSLTFSQSAVPGCFASIRRTSHPDFQGFGFPFPEQDFSWRSRWHSRGWNTTYEIVDSCVKWDEWERMDLE